MGWGDNSNGLILGASSECGTPVHIMDDIRMVSAEQDYAMAVKSDGTLWGWGRNRDGAIFTQEEFRRCGPTQLMSEVKSVSASDMCMCSLILMEDGDLYSVGQSGPGSFVSYKQRTAAGALPIKVLSGVAEAIAGNGVSYARLMDGRLLSIGRNELGQCGNGKSTGVVRSPITIMTHAIGMGAGYHHGVGLQENGDLWIWGADYGISEADAKGER